MKKRWIIMSLLSITLIGVGCYSKHIYDEYRIEQARIAHINKDSIDLKTFIDIADNVGHSNNYQLNWKEIVAVAGIITNDYIETLDTTAIENIAKMFINSDENRVNTYEEVINSLELNEKQIERANVYLKDLDTYGYMPEKYLEDSREMKFINSIKEQAIDNYNKYKILPSITIAQAIVESGWGETKLSTDANNLFGIKADIYWKGEKVTYETKEYNNTYIMDEFRKYDDKNQSIEDHAKFLVENNRYKKAGVFDAKTYKEQALKLQEAGYSTAEDEYGNKIYADKLITIIKQYNLQLIDHELMKKNMN